MNTGEVVYTLPIYRLFVFNFTTVTQELYSATIFLYLVFYYASTGHTISKHIYTIFTVTLKKKKKKKAGSI